MNYKFDLERGSYNWTTLFSAISLPQFHQVAEFLDFPIPISADLRQLAHDFAFSYYEMIMNRPDLEGYRAFQKLVNAPVPETVSFDLFKGAPIEDTNKTFYERLNRLYLNTFHHLEAMGVAEEIYRWGKQTRNHYHGLRPDIDHLSDFSSLEYWLLVLRNWAGVEWLAHNMSWKAGDEIGSWTSLISKLAHILTYNSNIEERFAQLNRLPLPNTAHTIQTMILNHEAQILHFLEIVQGLEDVPSSIWEQFCRNTYTWIKLEGRHRLNLKAWLQIYDLLSLDEIHILEEWMRQHQDDYSRLKVPLPDFRAILYGID
jgi:hypothetical protein